MYDLTCLLVTYNHENTIRKAIESVLEQKTKYKYIIKILDDCSTDATLEICKEYVKKYPDKIELYTVSKNTRCKTLPAIMKKIDTKYYCILDCDDYWCNENKIEQCLDILENNPQYIMVGHNTNLNYISKKKLTPVVNKNIKDNLITLENYQYLHISALIYRSEFLLNKNYKNMKMRDIFLYYAYLENGSCYYINEIMSVYNITGEGTWSKLPSEIQKYAITCLRPYNCNKISGFKYDKIYTTQVNKKTLNFMKKHFGIKLGWYFYYLYYKFRIRKKLERKLWSEIRRIELSYFPYTKKELNLINWTERNMMKYGTDIPCVSNK